MTTTYSAAVDEINAIFWNDWNSTKTSDIVGYVPAVRWEFVESQELPDSSKVWCRVSTQTVGIEQTTLSDSVGEQGHRRYTATGLVFVQIFCPKSLAQAGEFGRALSQVARNSFRGKSTQSGIWFRNARVNELPMEDLYYRFNVISEFEYDERG